MRKSVFLLLLSLCFNSCSKKNYNVNNIFSEKTNNSKTYIGLENLNNKLIIYLPCDASNKKSIMFENNQVHINIGEEEIYTIKDSIQKSNITEYNLENEFQKCKLSKKNINSETLFFLQLRDTNLYLLTTSISNAMKYPIIENECEEKTEELKFETIDFNKLWNINE